MVTGELKNKAVDGLWEIFWTGGLRQIRSM